MLIGFMHNYNTPTELAKITSIVCRYYGLDLIYLRPDNVDIENHNVTGKMLINGQWKKVTTEIPPFIDVVPYCFKKRHREKMDYLRKHTFLSDNRINVLTKDQLQEKLKEDSQFSNLVIPTHNLNDFNEMLSLIDNYGTVVVKPLRGIQGKGIYIVTKEDDKFIVGHYTNNKEMSVDEFRDFYLNNLTTRKHILQKFVASRTLQGDPFDCRVHVEKNSEGKWQSAKNYIRVGIGQTVISNVNQGGGISDPKSFLKANFGSDWEQIYSEIEKIAITLPYKVEELRGTHIMSLGIDVGIDKDGSLYLYEVNDGPATFSLKTEVALSRVGYYRYIMKNLV